MKKLRIVFISDLHNVSFGDHNRILADKVKALCPDLVLIGGDIVIGKPGAPMDQAMVLLEALNGDVPVYAANGNHEYRLRIYPETYGTMYQSYREGLERCGVRLLENESVSINIRGMGIVINGYELPRQYYGRFYRGELPEEEIFQVFPERDDSSYQIFLAHDPKYFPTYVRWNPDLILAGHYHGGIVRLGRNRAVVGNDFTLFPQYGYGMYHKNNTTMIVSAGLGEHTLPVRIHNPRELVVIDIGK